MEIEIGRYKQSWIPREQQLCKHCELNLIEDEKHCPKYSTTRETFFPQFGALNHSFLSLNDSEKLLYILGENETAVKLAAKYVYTIRDV